MRPQPAGLHFDALEPRQILAADLALSLGTILQRDDSRGGSIIIDAAVTNSGNIRYPGGGQVVFFLSTDTDLDAADVRIGSRPIPRLSATGQRQAIRLTARKSSIQAPEGTYQVLARLQVPGTFDSNPDNNIALAASTVSLAPGGSGTGSGSGGGPTTQSDPPVGAIHLGDLSISLGTLTTRRERNGDTLEVRATVTNLGSSRFSSGGQVAFYLSLDSTLGDEDFEFATLNLGRLMSRGARQTLTLKVNAPNRVNPAAPLAAIPEGDYQIIGELRLNDPAFDANPANDTAVATGTFDVDYRFGSFENRTRVPITFELPDGTTATARIEGPGIGRLTRDRDGRTVILIAGTTTSSNLVIDSNSRRGVSLIDSIQTSSPIQSVRAPKVVIAGLLSFDSTVSTVKLAGLRGGSLTIAGPALSAELELGDILNSNLTSNDTPIRRLTVNSWRDTDASADFLRAPFIRLIQSNNDFQPSVRLTSFDEDGLSFRKIKIGGDLSGFWQTSAGAGIVQAASTSPTFRMGILGPLESFEASRNMSGTLTAERVRRLTVGGSINGLTLLAGATLGNDLLLGGTGGNLDRYFAGTIEDIRVKGSINNSIFAAGLSSTDAILLNDDDRFVSSGFSGIRLLDVRRQVTNTTFLGPNLPDSVRIDRRSVSTDGDSRFVSQLP